MMVPFGELSSDWGVRVPTTRPASVRASVASSTVWAFTFGTATVAGPVLKRLSPSKKIREAASTVAKPVKNQRVRLFATFCGATAIVPDNASTIGIVVVVSPKAIASVL